MANILVTGGAGFIGSCYVIERVKRGDRVLNLDKLTYSSNLKNLTEINNASNYFFKHGDIGDKAVISDILHSFNPDCIVNFAAETHVDRSICNPSIFLETNVMGTEALLSSTLNWWKTLPRIKREMFRFIHISTDEVYGSLSFTASPFTENSLIAPNSPYSASKAASDLICRAYYHTYGFPVIVSNCSNNYGPRQFPEKLIPLMILSAIQGKKLPIYGQGLNIRDWLHVSDHCSAIEVLRERGMPGQKYNIGGNNEISNIDVVNHICGLLDKKCPSTLGRSYKNQIQYVTDRPGHDLRYAIDASKIKRELGWIPSYTFEQGIEETVDWYLNNPNWLASIKTSEFNQWIKKNYANRMQN